VKTFGKSSVRVLKNPENAGFAGNVFRLIEEVRTDYLTIVSDEDTVNKEALETLIEFCRTQRPRMVCPRARSVVSEDYRGLHETREIEPREFSAASFYISGLTFETESVRRYKDDVRRLVPSNSAATVYPQVLLTALAVASGGSYFLDAALTSQADTHPSHIVDPSGITYASVAGRMAQFKGYEEFFGGDQSSVQAQDARERFALMREQEREGFIWLLAQAAAAEAPALRPYLQQSFVRLALAPIRKQALRPVGAVVRRLKGLVAR
jgi:hypothetical protein